MHNLVICSNRNRVIWSNRNKNKTGEKSRAKSESDKTETATNYASSVSSVLLQNAEIISENPLIKNEVRLKILFV